MLKSELLRAIQQEIYQHDFSHFVDEPPSIAQGGRGVVVSGCPACKKKFGTMPQFLDHLAGDVMPALFARLGSKPPESGQAS
jgi:hypothetical protein